MKKMGTVLLALDCVLFLISAAVTAVLAFKPLYYYDMVHLELAEETGYSEEEIAANYEELIDYNLSPFQEELEFPTFPMSEKARIHFREVKQVFQFFIRLMFLTGVLAGIGALRKRKVQDYEYLKVAGILGIVMPVGLIVLIAVNWQWVFVLFHRLVFQNDYWLFDPATDPVILILPDTFFLHCAVLILGIVLAGAFGCFIAFGVFCRRKGRVLPD